ncbi:hypothetical protein Cni_G16714 [Canna indica]|uniref:Reverse transcriptase domain-containing protein n=1 Tax=Canna indica TaxID=4628 RepID=A0AAQ3QEG0_9LILI|nr:hypothetical protein Cni_G16714 [Canna indica]
MRQRLAVTREAELWKRDDSVSELSMMDKLKWIEVNEEEAVDMEKNITMEEIKIAANSFGRGKSPGWNDTTLVMIPKKENAKDIGEFRPIALCNILYKILAKVILNRIRPVLEKVISSAQSAFMPNRLIQDNIFVVAEVVNSIHGSKAMKPYILVKIDLQKAYGRVSWMALYAVMKKLKFPQKMIMWIKGCIENAKLRCKTNGVMSQEFVGYKGIRQGDPMSPFLFIILEELLHAIIRYYVENKWIDPFKLHNFEMSHLCFADDVIFTMKSNWKSLKGLKEAISLYCKMSNQRINEEKSMIYFPKALAVEQKHKISNFLCMKEAKYPMQYLGTYLTPRRMKKDYENKIVEKVVARMDLWARNLISQAGKVVLLNSVTSSMLVYNLMATGLNENTVEKIVKKRRNFLWANMNSKGAKLVKWEILTTAKGLGGLGVRDLSVMRKIMAAKRMLPLPNGQDNNWSKIYIEKLICGMILGWSIPLSKWPTYINVEEMKELVVVADLKEKEKWKSDLIDKCFGTCLKENISVLQFDSKEAEDKWIWRESLDGRLTTKSAYYFFKRRKLLIKENNFNWKQMWTLKVAEKIKLSYGRLLGISYLLLNG